MSYRSDYVSEVESLVSHLQLWGTSVWFDRKDIGVDLLAPQFSHALSLSEGLVFYFTRDALDRPAIRDHEIRLALEERDKRPNDFFILPILRNISHREAADQSLSTYGFDFTALRYENIGRIPQDSTASLTNNFDHIGNELFRYRMQRVASRVKHSGIRGIRLDLHGHLRTAYPLLAEVDLDWTPLVQKQTGISSEASATMKNVLRGIRGSFFNDLGPCTIRVRSVASLGVSFLLGMALRKPSPFTVTIEQPLPDGGVQEWETHDFGDQDELQVEFRELATSGDDLAIFAGISHSILSTARPSLGHYRIQPKAEVIISPASGPNRTFIRSGAHGVAAAARIADEIHKAHNRAGTSRAHLFISAPVALAVSLGIFGNVLGEVVTYTYDSTKRSYNQLLNVASDEI